jgi:hypothetical protein
MNKTNNNNDTNNNSFALISIVAIVAVIGIIGLVVFVGNNQANITPNYVMAPNGDLGGNARHFTTSPEALSDGKHPCVCSGDSSCYELINGEVFHKHFCVLLLFLFRLF